MLSAYFDESGTDKTKSSALTVAGYISSVEMWASFQIEWQKMLDDEGLKYFHMTDLECLKDQFSASNGWDKKRQIRVIQRSHDIIKRNTLQEFESSLDWSAYDETIVSYTGKHTPPAYFILASDCIAKTAGWAKSQGYTEPIDYVFEDGVKDAGFVIEAITHGTKYPEVREALLFGSLTYANKRRLIQLQAADVNAYESWKHMENRFVKGQLRDIRKSVLNLKTTDGGIWAHHFGSKELAHYLTDLAKVDFE